MMRIELQTNWPLSQKAVNELNEKYSILGNPDFSMNHLNFYVEDIENNEQAMEVTKVILQDYPDDIKKLGENDYYRLYWDVLGVVDGGLFESTCADEEE
jgi:hypothetical protein